MTQTLNNHYCHNEVDGAEETDWLSTVIAECFKPVIIGRCRTHIIFKTVANRAQLL